MRLRTMILGVFGLLVCTMAPKPMPEEFVHDFKRGIEDNPMLVLSGRSARTVTRVDGQGLRVSLSEKRQNPSIIAITPRFTIQGDFDATLSYDFVSSVGPYSKSGVGIHFIVKTLGDDPQRLSITRSRKAGDKAEAVKETFGANSTTIGADGKKTYDTTLKPASQKSGRLRIEQTGEQIKLLAADGPTNSFNEIKTFHIGAEKIKSLKIECMAPEGGIDVRLVELVVHAESLGNKSSTVDDSAGIAMWIWVTAAVLVIIAGIGVWWFMIKRKA